MTTFEKIFDGMKVTFDESEKFLELYTDETVHLNKDFFANDACKEIEILKIEGFFTFDDGVFDNLPLLGGLQLSFGDYEGGNANKITSNTFKNLPKLVSIVFSGAWMMCLTPGCFDNLKLEILWFHADHCLIDIQPGIFDTLPETTDIDLKGCQIYSLKNFSHFTMDNTGVHTYPANEEEFEEYKKQLKN